MSETFVESINPAIRNFHKLEKNVGAEISIRRVGSGGKEPNLRGVLEQSLLGDRLTGYEVDENALNNYEKQLRSKKDLKIRTIVDFDGVMISLIHGQTKVGVKNMLWLARVTKASDKTTIWTNRLQPEEGRLSNSGWFPFLGRKVSERITNSLKSQGEVNVDKKSLQGSSKQLVEYTDEADITIFIGSGEIDRKIVEKYVDEGGDPNKLIYFDTGHLIL